MEKTVEILKIISGAIMQIVELLTVPAIANSNDQIPDAPILAPVVDTGDDQIPDAPGSRAEVGQDYRRESERTVEIDAQGIPWTEGLHRKNHGKYSRKTGVYPKGSWIIQPGLDRQEAADKTTELIKQHRGHDISTPGPDEECKVCGVNVVTCGAMPDSPGCKAAIEKLNSTPPAAEKREPRRVIHREVSYEMLNNAVNDSDLMDPDLLRECCKFAGVKVWLDMVPVKHKGLYVEKGEAVEKAYLFLSTRGIIDKIAIVEE